MYGYLRTFIFAFQKTVYKRNAKILEKYLHINIEKYVELMPRDKQDEYRMLEERKNEKMENRNGVIFNITGG